MRGGACRYENGSSGIPWVRDRLPWLARQQKRRVLIMGALSGPNTKCWVPMEPWRENRGMLAAASDD